MNKLIERFILLIELFLLSGVCISQTSNTNDSKFSAQVEIDTITNRLLRKLLSEQIDEHYVVKFMDSLQIDGSWKDINYDDHSIKNWNPQIHLNRLKLMATALKNQKCSLYQKKALCDKIALGIDFFFIRKPVSDNWWFNIIGAPQDFASILILMKDQLNADLLQKYSSYIKDDTNNQAHRGANRTWVSEIIIYKGCIENNFSLIKKGFASIASTLTVEPEQGVEGIKIDLSFHQHRAQLYSGGYGMSFIDGIAQFMTLCEQTPFSEVFTPEKRQLFSNLMLKGHQLFGYRNAIDFGTIGRGISRANSIQNINPKVLDLMIVSDPSYAKDYLAWKEHLQGADFPAKFQGNNFFWKSAIMTQHGANYYLSAKIISSRTTGTEMLNKQNLKGYNLPLGATNILTTGNEYRNIAPVWDWTRIPGTTSVINQSSTLLSWYLFGSNSFAGGVSDSKNGILAYEHAYNGIQALKGYFFIGDALLCMGTGISAFPTQPVVTSVNQSLLNGEITIGQGDETRIFSDSSRIFSDLKWVYHDRVGYIFPESGEISLQQVTQSGSWKLIDDDAKDKPVSMKVFNLWVNHGNAPKNQSYCYIVMPGKTLPEFKKLAHNHGFVIVRNDNDIQAIRNDTLHQYAIVFYQPDTVNLGNGLQISSDKKILVLIEKQADRYLISVADPLYTQPEVNLLINQKLAGNQVSYTKNGSKLHLLFPAGIMAGSTTSNSYRILK